MNDCNINPFEIRTHTAIQLNGFTISLLVSNGRLIIVDTKDIWIHFHEINCNFYSKMCITMILVEILIGKCVSSALKRISHSQLISYQLFLPSFTQKLMGFFCVFYMNFLQIVLFREEEKFAIYLLYIRTFIFTKSINFQQEKMPEKEINKMVTEKLMKFNWDGDQFDERDANFIGWRWENGRKMWTALIETS